MALGTPQPRVTLFGVPLDHNSSYLTGPAQAPPLIRRALSSPASNSWSETGIDIGSGILADEGDLELPDPSAAFDSISSSAARISQNSRPLFLGGDHSITFPLIRGLNSARQPLTIIHFDAHPDLYHEFEGNPHSHACPFARIMEQNFASRLIQIGIRTANAHQRHQASKFGVEILGMQSVDWAALRISGSVYVSFDIDALDPAFAPGVSHREPGGLSVRDAISHLHSIPAPIIAADLVEYNPAQDLSSLTATVCAKLVKELVGVLARG